jgi:YfiR/HmsC-like
MPGVTTIFMRLIKQALVLLLVSSASVQARATELSEYQLKAAFLYNFAVFTEWPADVGTPLNLCILGPDPFGDEINDLQGKAVGNRTLAVLRKTTSQSLNGCHIVFITAQAIRSLPRVLDETRERAVLTVAESTGAARQGAVLNMAVAQNRVTFEASQAAARASRLTLSSKLLRLATEVYP